MREDLEKEMERSLPDPSMGLPDAALRTLLQSAPGLYVVMAPDLRIVAVSDAYLRGTMTSRDQILGHGILEVFPDNPDEPSVTGTRNLRASLARVIESLAPDAMAVQKHDVRRPEDEGGGFEERYWSPVNLPVLDGEQGKLLYIIHRVEDVTEVVRLKRHGAEQRRSGEELQGRAERMEAEIFQRTQQIQKANEDLRAVKESLAQRDQEIAVLNDQLRRLDSAKSHLFANVSHELGTVPLESRFEQRTAEPNAEVDRSARLEAAYRALFERSPYPMWVFDVDTLAFLAVNAAAIHLYGYSREEFLQMTLRDIRPAEEVSALEEDLLERVPGYKPPRTWRHKKKDGTIIFVEVSRNEVTFSGRAARVVLLNDISERKTLQEQLLQSQKMDAIGSLAGGVAHDFNNLLMAIITFATFVRDALEEGSAARQDQEEVLRAAGRAAELTRQLLAFSRQQVVEPRVLGINDLVSKTDKMLRRVVGEHIEIVTLMARDLWLARIDPGQFEQVLVNLAVNARDAMPRGGKLIIETANVVLDETYEMTHVGAGLGEHVMLAVSDTGIGMDESVKSRIFEPFFTTKERGKGTGLGLSTCFGIVKQAGGNIWVYSEPGRGATFKIYLPRARGEEAAPEGQAIGREGPSGRETIFVVEDEPGVRAAVVRTLAGLGYSVLEAISSEHAVQVATDHKGAIHLLVTDVVMPQMGGRQLAEYLAAWHPEMKVIYMSGYTDNAIVHHGELHRDVAFLQKPFSADALGRKVREALDGPPS